MALSMDRWLGKVVVVTGASSGIGYASAIALFENGFIVVGLARRLDRLEELKKSLHQRGHLRAVPKGTFIPRQCDITDETQVVSTFSWIKENVGPVAVLINNAGVALSGPIGNGDYANWKAIFDTNVMGLLTCTREAIKQMNEANIAGNIIHINSLAGHRVPELFPGLAVYSASKFGVTAITETLRIELREKKSQIKVTSLSPGAVESEMSTQNPNLSEELKKQLSKWTFLKAEDIADAVIYALSTPEHVQIHELTIGPI